MSMDGLQVAALFEEARALSFDFSSRASEDVDRLAGLVIHASQGVCGRILETMDLVVRAAATVGATRVDILRFHGNDIDDVSGLSLLSMVKGARDPALREALARNGFTTLVDLLAEKVDPFEVRHVWHQRSNLNRLVLSW